MTQAIKVTAISNIREGMLGSSKEHAVGFYLMYVPNWGGKGDIAYRVGLVLL